MRLYLDACILGRLSDDQSHPRISSESAAITKLFRLIFLGQIDWISSTALRREISFNPNIEKRSDALSLLEYAAYESEPDEPTILRAGQLTSEGYGAFDALRLACAEALGADALLTTDDRLLRRAGRGIGNPYVLVTKPVNWLLENVYGSR